MPYRGLQMGMADVARVSDDLIGMADVSATEAARKFADLLDAVERGEHFTIIRRGKAVAHLKPLHRGRGADVKSVLRSHEPDADWANELVETRQLATWEQRI